MPYLTHIQIYPIKALDPVVVTQATVLPGGALQFDRQFAIFDEEGKFVNGKRNQKVHQLRSSFDSSVEMVTLQTPGMESPQVFHLYEERETLETCLSQYFGKTVQLRQNSNGGFPDDTNAFGPTVISTATLAEVGSWFSLEVAEVRSRLRANLEIDGVPAFWEDRLFSEDSNASLWFQIGEVTIEGVNPCARCVVPARNPLTGEAYPNFQKIFVAKRQETLPSWAPASRFNHFYRLSANTRIPKSEAGKILRVGDEVKILSP